MNHRRDLAEILDLIVRCERCGRAAQLEDDEMPSDDWIQTWDAETHDGATGWLCPLHQTGEQIVEHMTRSEETNEIIDRVIEQERIEEEFGPPPGGRATDEMLGVPPGGFDEPDDDMIGDS